MVDTILHIVSDFGLLALFSLGVVALRPLANGLPNRALHQGLLGVMFGLLAAVVMLDPIRLPEGATFDARGGPAILAGVFAGPLGAAIAAAIGAAVRYWGIGGPVALGGVAGFALYGLAGVIAGAVLARRGLRPGPLALLLIGAFGTLMVIPSFFVSADWATGWTIIGKAWPILLSANLVGTLLVGLVVSFAERQAHLLAHRKSRAEEADTLALVASHTTTAVIIFDPQGRIEWVNAGFEALTGYPRAEVLGLSPADFLRGPDTDPAVAARIDDALKRGEACHEQLLNHTRDGRPYWVDVTCQPVHVDGRLRGFISVETDITDQKTLEARLLRAEQVAKVGHWRVKLPEEVAVWSDQVYRILGRAPGQPLPSLPATIDFYLPEDRPRVRQQVYRTIETGEPLAFRARIKVEGEIKWLDVRGDAEHGRDGQVSAIFGIVQDVSELARHEIELAEARDQADAANHSKSEFLATMSHELRTPLNAILGFSEILTHQMFGPIQGDPRYLEYLGDIHDSGQILLELVNDVLDLSKIEAGQFELDETEVTLPEATARALRLVRQRALAHHLEITVARLETAPPLRADQRLVVQMLFNLLTNAIKFTPAGGRIEVFFEPMANGGMALTVKDSGIGMSAEDLAQATQPYFQARTAQARPVVSGGMGGTGLGLTLVSRMMEMHQGRLRLDSAPGQGTTARLVFPAARVVAGGG
ncbi:PAS domain S-box protein [Roseospirillum parvum]|uniref:histidine kinase n=1 Tax=Roseospirillum parvum TaxID=83401 RepID=A0A1G7WU77_9PROT|nr:PAS domain S-box protein [Roseospirillum parvum]SDG75491.1 PAS domain S-box-containing protein [Roseospirillum parvum]